MVFPCDFAVTKERIFTPFYVVIFYMILFSISRRLLVEVISFRDFFSCQCLEEVSG